MEVWFAKESPRDFGHLRAGWRILAFVILLGCIGAASFALILFLRGGATAKTAPMALQPLMTAASEWALFAWVLLTTFIMSRLERQPFRAYGLPEREAFGARFWQGAIWGALALTALLLLIAASGDFGFGQLAEHGSAAARFGLEWALAFLAVGFFEEYLFRGYLLKTLTGGIGFWWAAIVLSIMFGAAHLNNGGEDWLGALAAGLIGLFFCFTWQRTGSLWFAVGLHAGWDYCESFVYGVPDSGAITPGRLLNPHFHGSHWITGGTVGPEGSVWVLVIIALLFVLFGLWGPRRNVAAATGASAPANSLPTI